MNAIDDTHQSFLDALEIERTAQEQNFIELIRQLTFIELIRQLTKDEQAEYLKSLNASYGIVPAAKLPLPSLFTNVKAVLALVAAVTVAILVLMIFGVEPVGGVQ